MNHTEGFLVFWVRKIFPWRSEKFKNREFKNRSKSYFVKSIGNITEVKHCCWWSVPKSCPALGTPMDCCTPCSSVLHRVLACAQVHVHWVSDVIQTSHLLPPSPLAFNLSHHQGLFQWVGSSPQVAKVLKLFAMYLVQKDRCLSINTVKYLT